MRTIVRSGLAALAVALGIAAAGPAAAGTATLNRTAAAPPPADVLYSTSCVSASNCVAVGLNGDAFSEAGGPLAETWNGATWHTVAVQLPAGSTAGALGRVSCLSATDCVAVGFYDKGPGNQFALAETWNGTTWKPAEPPAPGGESTSLDGVSCVSASSCVAVGAYTANTKLGPAGAPLAETWNGHTWTQSRPPVPRGTVISGLAAVSCVTARSCIATGLYETLSGGGSVLIDSWNGTSWSLMKATAPAGSDEASLTGVSCTSAGSCTAVGYASGPKGLVSIAEMWNGTGWTLSTVRWPEGTSSPLLSGVSCVAANSCVAVGTIDSNLKDMSNTGRAAAVTWNGNAWTATSVPAPGKGKASLFKDVTCLTATDCVAVGQVGPAVSTNGTGLSGFWNGKSWRLVTAR